MVWKEIPLDKHRILDCRASFKGASQDVDLDPMIESDITAVEKVNTVYQMYFMINH